MNNNIRIVYKAPGLDPEVKTVDQSRYQEMQKIIDGGSLEAVEFSKGDYTLWCDEEGKMKHLLPNLNYLPKDIVVGPVFVTGGSDNEGYSTDLTDNDIVVIMTELKKRSMNVDAFD